MAVFLCFDRSMQQDQNQDQNRTAYLNFKQSIRKLVPEHLKRSERYLNQVETALGKSLLEALRASEIDQAIYEAASKRKTAYNGGHIDDGRGMRFRLGQAVVGYLRWAHSERITERNIYTKNNHPEPIHRTPNFFDEKKILQILKAFDSFDLIDRLLISLLLDTGLRVGELVRIKISDIDLNEFYIRVVQTKVGREKTVVFTQKTAGLIFDYLQLRELRCKKSDWLFQNNRKAFEVPFTTKYVNKRFRLLGNRLGFRLNPHAFRHSLGAIWMGNGAQETEILQQLGHRDRSMIEVYNHLSHKHLKNTQKRVYSRVSVLKETA